MIILTIIFTLTALLGLYCLIKPDNFLLPYAKFYYNPKHPFKPITWKGWKGSFGAKHIKEFGKTKGILLYMRIFGLTLLIISVIFLITILK